MFFIFVKVIHLKIEWEGLLNRSFVILLNITRVSSVCVDDRINACCQLGVFEMSQSGLQAVSNPSEMFLSDQYSDSEYLAGLAVAVIMDGSRTFLIEVQVVFW